MQTAQLIRGPSTDQGTTGLFHTEGFQCKTIELPWRENAKNISCVPAGVYSCEPYISSKFGSCYRLQDVPGRTDILIHSGNFAGNVDLGYKTDSAGCIMPGMSFAMLAGQTVVVSSKQALIVLKSVLGFQPFELTIIWQEEI